MKSRRAKKIRSILSQQELDAYDFSKLLENNEEMEKPWVEPDPIYPKEVQNTIDDVLENNNKK